MDETELARDEVNDLPGDERDAGRLSLIHI